MCERIPRLDTGSVCFKAGGIAQLAPHDVSGVGTSRGNAHGETSSAFAPSPLQIHPNADTTISISRQLISHFYALHLKLHSKLAFSFHYLSNILSFR